MQTRVPLDDLTGYRCGMVILNAALTLIEVSSLVGAENARSAPQACVTQELTAEQSTPHVPAEVTAADDSPQPCRAQLGNLQPSSELLNESKYGL